MCSKNIGDQGHFDVKHGSMSGPIEAIERLRVRAKLTEEELSAATPYSYIERSGWLRLPYECAVNFARAFAMQEPAGILAIIDSLERDYSLSASKSENAYQIRFSTVTGQVGLLSDSGAGKMRPSPPESNVSPTLRSSCGMPCMSYRSLGTI